MLLNPQKLNHDDAFLSRPAQPVLEVDGGILAFLQGELFNPLFDHGAALSSGFKTEGYECPSGDTTRSFQYV